jgi:hypothetical protein
VDEAVAEVEFVHPDSLVDVDGVSYGWVRLMEGQRRLVAPGVHYPHWGLTRAVRRVDYMLPGWEEER